MQQERPIVTIRCITYNQEKYIRQCLDGFVMQKTNFRFEAVVHDDASTDGTSDIIREYAERYPSIIKPIFETENQYSKEDGSLARIMDSQMRGRYIAICEGDDYWTSPDKLQKQVDFLESHPDYSMCFHQATRHYENSNKPDTLYCDVEDRDYTGQELYTPVHRPPTASVLMRYSVLESDVYKVFRKMCLSFSDIPIFLSCANCGKVRGMSENMSVYRMNAGGVTNVFNSTNDRVLKFANDNLKLYHIFGTQYKEECIRIYVIDYINHFFRCYHLGNLRPSLIVKPLMKHPCVTLRFFMNRLINYLQK